MSGTPPQIPGCLPEGYEPDKCMLTIAQFAVWQRVSERTVRAGLASMKGVIRRSREWVRIYPQAYLDGSLKK